MAPAIPIVESETDQSSNEDEGIRSAYPCNCKLFSRFAGLQRTSYNRDLQQILRCKVDMFKSVFMGFYDEISSLVCKTLFYNANTTNFCYAFPVRYRPASCTRIVSSYVAKLSTNEDLRLI